MFSVSNFSEKLFIKFMAIFNIIVNTKIKTQTLPRGLVLLFKQWKKNLPYVSIHTILHIIHTCYIIVLSPREANNLILKKAKWKKKSIKMAKWFFFLPFLMMFFRSYISAQHIIYIILFYRFIFLCFFFLFLFPFILEEMVTQKKCLID